MDHYDDFWIRLEAEGPHAFRASVLSSPAGSGSEPFHDPLGEENLPTHPALAPLARTMTQRGGTTFPLRDIVEAHASPLPRDLGQTLFDALFVGTVRSLFDKSLGMAQARGRGLRIKLHADPADARLAKLAALPWEMLYFHGTREYLSLSEFTPLVRFLDVQRPYEPPPFVEPLRVLVALANPHGSETLDLEKERTLIESSWAKLDDVEVDFLDHATRDGLRRTLAEKGYHVLHFMGHGGFDASTGEGALQFEDDRGDASLLTGPALGVLLRDLPTMRLVFLNACETARSTESDGQDPFAGVASALVLAGMPAVLAMQFPISDPAAIAFAQGFYTALVQKRPVDAAVGAGRKAIHEARPDSLEWATPVLFMRAPDGHLFKPEQPLITARRVGWAVAAVVVVLVAWLAFAATRPLSLAPAEARIALAATATLSALSNGEPVVPDAWTSSDTSVATVREGRVVGLRPGTSRITARMGWFSRASTDVVVYERAPSRVRMARHQVSLAVGDTLPLRAAVESDDGYALTTEPLAWSADDAAVAEVTASGDVIGRSVGRTVVRARTDAGLTDTVQVSVWTLPVGETDPEDEPPPDPSANTPPTLVRFALAERSAFTEVARDERPLFSASVALANASQAACVARLDDPTVVRTAFRYLVEDPDYANSVLTSEGGLDEAARMLREQLRQPGMTQLKFRFEDSAGQNWQDIAAPADREVVRGLAETCIPPPPDDALVFSITLKNPTQAYVNVYEVRYLVLQDGGEAGGGAGAGVLTPLATYLHRIERECGFESPTGETTEVYPFDLDPILELYPGRSATFELQPSIRVRDYPNAFLAPLLMRIEIVTDAGIVRTESFWVEGTSCAG